MADRGEVKIREGNLDDLIKLYKKTYEDTLKEIQAATEAGRIRKFAVLARINRNLSDLGVDVKTWVEEEIPQYYRDGANQAAQDLKASGYDVSKRQGFAVIDSQSIVALTDEVALSFAESIKGISRSAIKVLSNAQKQQLNFIIAQGRLSGEARKIVSSQVEAYLRDQGLGVLKDAAGREWSYENYSRMLVRTKAVEARNQGLQNRMLTSGYDLVQVSNHSSSHAACAYWEGKILSLTGATVTGTELPGGYVVAGTYQEANNKGLFHPNCRHAINVIVPELAAKTHAYENPYNTLSHDEYIKAYPDSPEAIQAAKEAFIRDNPDSIQAKNAQRAADRAKAEAKERAAQRKQNN